MYRTRSDTMPSTPDALHAYRTINRHADAAAAAAADAASAACFARFAFGAGVGEGAADAARAARFAADHAADAADALADARAKGLAPATRRRAEGAVDAAAAHARRAADLAREAAVEHAAREIAASDLQIDVCYGQGSMGPTPRRPHAVRVTHVPTGKQATGYHDHFVSAAKDQALRQLGAMLKEE